MAILDIFKRDKRPVVSPISAVLPEQIYKQGVLELQDVIAPSALKITPREINLGDKIARTFFVMSYPRVLTESWFAPVINLDRVLDISIFIHPIDSAEILKTFQKKVAEVQSQIATREQKGLVRDPVLDTAYQDIEQLRDQLQQAQERIFDVGVYITIYGGSIEELDKAESEIKSMLESRLVYVKPALFQQEQGFRSVLPLGRDEMGVNSKLNSSPLSSIFPFVSFDLTSDKGILYGVNRHNASLVLFDRFSLENYNSVIFAKSGSGKSYATKLEILRTLMFDTEVIVIDPEREYEFLSRAVGGRYFNISLSSEHHINPFDLPVPREDESPTDVLRPNIVALVGLFRIMLGGLTAEEDSIIDQAITETYALKDITPDSDFSQIEPPLLSDFEQVLAGMEGGASLVQRLSKYTKGTWAGFINEPTNVDINKRFVVFSVRDMEDELKPVAMYLVTHFIWNTVRKNLKKRLLVIDEAWWMMKSEDTASFLYGIAKRGRKYYLGLATITQDVDDFLKSPYGLPMITNSSLQMLLKQSPSSIDTLQKTFNLSDEEKYLLLESDVGEGIFFAGLKHVAIKVIASYTEDQIITSDPSQVLALRQSREQIGETPEEEPETARPRAMQREAGSGGGEAPARALRFTEAAPEEPEGPRVVIPVQRPAAAAPPQQKPVPAAVEQPKPAAAPIRKEAPVTAPAPAQPATVAPAIPPKTPPAQAGIPAVPQTEKKPAIFSTIPVVPTRATKPEPAAVPAFVPAVKPVPRASVPPTATSPVKPMPPIPVKISAAPVAPAPPRTPIPPPPAPPAPPYSMPPTPPPMPPPAPPAPPPSSSTPQNAPLTHTVPSIEVMPKGPPKE